MSYEIHPQACDFSLGEKQAQEATMELKVAL